MMGSLNTQEDLDLDIIDTSLLSQERLNQFLKESVDWREELPLYQVSINIFNDKSIAKHSYNAEVFF